MADVNRGNRPLSPHVSIYRLPLNAILSIGHRITGVALSVTALLVVWWFLSAAISPQHFATADWFLTSWFGTAIMVLSALGLWLHFFNGVRHLIWDTGSWFGNHRAHVTGQIVVALAVVMTVITVILA